MAGEVPATTSSRSGRGYLEDGRLVAERYRVERRLARGGQASVYLAYQEPLNRAVALKVLMAPLDANEAERRDFEERFLLEARILASLDHPNIVTVFDYGEVDDGQFYIAMEYVDGKRFNDLLREGRLDPKRALRILLQVCGALRYAHHRGVIHRDVKNSNVLIRRTHNGEEQVKVVDFGIVKLSESDTSLTQAGVILGSPHFMAPEQAQGKNVDHRIDIYAVGVLMFCALMGRYPFDGAHSTAILTAHLTRPVPSFDQAQPGHGLSRELEQVVRRCLAKDPAKRFDSMDTLIGVLQPYADVELPSGSRSPMATINTGGGNYPADPLSYSGHMVSVDTMASGPHGTTGGRTQPEVWRARGLAVAAGAGASAAVVLVLMLLGGAWLWFVYMGRAQPPAETVSAETVEAPAPTEAEGAPATPEATSAAPLEPSAADGAEPEGVAPPRASTPASGAGASGEGTSSAASNRSSGSARASAPPPAAPADPPEVGEGSAAPTPQTGSADASTGGSTPPSVGTPVQTAPPDDPGNDRVIKNSDLRDPWED